MPSTFITVGDITINLAQVTRIYWDYEGCVRVCFSGTFSDPETLSNDAIRFRHDTPEAKALMKLRGDRIQSR